MKDSVIACKMPAKRLLYKELNKHGWLKRFVISLVHIHDIVTTHDDHTPVSRASDVEHYKADLLIISEQWI